jgi:single-strand DNA-binding protein
MATRTLTANTRSGGTDGSAAAAAVAEPENSVFLRGVFAGEAILRTLPSGDELCSFRITVARPPGARARVDSIDCSATGAAVRRGALRCQAGDLIEVRGSLRRRFWRGPGGGPSSRYEVEVTTLKNRRRSR